MEKFFVLGAPDAEMTGIENLLQAQQQTYVFAVADARRVHAGNAYKADAVVVPESDMAVVLVECQPANIDELRRDHKIIVVDHHRPGDPGYSMDAAHFFESSSIGQVYALLGVTNVPHSDIVLAAMDAQPSAAIRGLCPGVSAQEVLERKVQEIASQTRQPQEVVQRILNEVTVKLESAPVFHIGTQDVHDLSDTAIGPDYASIAATQTAVLAGGLVALLKQQERDGRVKVTISGHAEPGTVKAFMDEYAVAHNLHDIYGVPQRGFAGGYLQ